MVGIVFNGKPWMINLTLDVLFSKIWCMECLPPPSLFTVIPDDRVTPINGAPGTIDCAQITLSATSTVNGTSVNTFIVGKEAQVGTNNIGTSTGSADGRSIPSSTTILPSTVTNAQAFPPGEVTVTVTLPLQPSDRCNPFNGDSSKSTKRLGFLGVTLASSLTKDPHQPMDDSPVWMPCV